MRRQKESQTHTPVVLLLPPSACRITNGGLNYQIEHHLFPRMSHAHYSLIAPVVREVCEKHNVAYVHFDTILGNVLSCARQLKLLGTTKVADMKAKKQK